MNEWICIVVRILLKFVPDDPIDNKSVFDSSNVLAFSERYIYSSMP